MQLVTGHAMVYLVNFHERLRAIMDHYSNEVITNAYCSGEARSHRTFMVTRQRDHPHSLSEPSQVFSFPGRTCSMLQNQP